MHGDWCIRCNAPGDHLFVAISVQHPKLGDYFSATLTAKRLSSSTVADNALFFWLMPHKVAVWIYWHVSYMDGTLIMVIRFIKYNDDNYSWMIFLEWLISVLLS